MSKTNSSLIYCLKNQKLVIASDIFETKGDTLTQPLWIKGVQRFEG